MTHAEETEFLPSASNMKKRCSVQGCDRKAIARGFCEPHWDRWHRNGDPNPNKPIGDKSGKNNPKWRGGVIRFQGRVALFKPDHPYRGIRGYVLRYRLVMESHLGRYLRPDEVVHHKNGDPSDDRLENLEVMSFSQHAKLHRANRGHNEFGQFL